MSSFIGPESVTSGMVLCLDAANVRSYPGTGTTWYDLSGNNTGTLVNTPTFSSNYFRFLYSSSEYASFPSIANIQFLNKSPYTLETWMYPMRNPGAVNYTGILDRESTFGAGRDGYNIYFLGSGTTDTLISTERFCANVGTAASISLSQTESVNKWHNIVATYDSATLRLYRNGNLASSTTSSGNILNTSKTLTIGVRGTQYFDGGISNVIMYNRALSDSEIIQNFEARRWRYGI